MPQRKETRCTVSNMLPFLLQRMRNKKTDGKKEKEKLRLNMRRKQSNKPQKEQRKTNQRKRNVTRKTTNSIETVNKKDRTKKKRR